MLERLNSVVKDNFVRLTYTEGVELLEKAVKDGHKFEFPVSWGMDLASEHERYLVEHHFKKPVIMSDYPKDIKAFYMKVNEDGKTVQGTDVLFPQIGEIIGGSIREESYDKLVILIKTYLIKGRFVTSKSPFFIFFVTNSLSITAYFLPFFVFTNKIYENNK